MRTRRTSISDLITVAEPNLRAVSTQAKRFASLTPEQRRQIWERRGLVSIRDVNDEHHYRLVNYEPTAFAQFIARNPQYEPVPYEEAISGNIIGAEAALNVAGVASLGGDRILMRCTKEVYQEKQALLEEQLKEDMGKYYREYREAMDEIAHNTGGAIVAGEPRQEVEVTVGTAETFFTETTS